MILSVCLNPAVDRTSEGAFYPVRKVKKVKKAVYSAGGKGVNIARAIKTLGSEALIIGFSGGYTGRFFESLLLEEGINGCFIPIKGMTRLNWTMLEPAAGRETHFVEPGPKLSSGEVLKFRDIFEKVLSDENIDCAVFSGSLPPGAPEDIYFELIKESRKRGIKTALDTRGGALKKSICAKPDMIKPNKEELEELAGRKLKTIGDAADFAAGLDIPETLVSMGGRGSILASGGGMLRAAPVKTSGLSSVGCGDALLAGYIFSRFLKNERPEDALTTGSACALANLRGRLPGAFSLKDIKTCKREIKVKRMDN